MNILYSFYFEVKHICGDIDGYFNCQTLFDIGDCHVVAGIAKSLVCAADPKNRAGSATMAVESSKKKKPKGLKHLFRKAERIKEQKERASFDPLKVSNEAQYVSKPGFRIPEFRNSREDNLCDGSCHRSYPR